MISHKIHRYSVVHVDDFYASGNKGGDYFKVRLSESYDDLVASDIIQLEVAHCCVVPIRVELPVDVFCRWLTDSFFEMYNGKVSNILKSDDSYDAKLLEKTKESIEFVSLDIKDTDNRVEKERKYKDILTILIRVDDTVELLSCLDAEDSYDSYTLEAISEHLSHDGWVDQDSGIYAVKCSLEYSVSWTDAGQEYDSEIKFHHIKKLSDIEFDFSEEVDSSI